MYATDRGIEELADRRGEQEVSLAWLADRPGADDHGIGFDGAVAGVEFGP